MEQNHLLKMSDHWRNTSDEAFIVGLTPWCRWSITGHKVVHMPKIMAPIILVGYRRKLSHSRSFSQALLPIIPHCMGFGRKMCKYLNYLFCS